MYFKPLAAIVMRSFRICLLQLAVIAACLFYLPAFGAGYPFANRAAARPGANIAADVRLKGKVTDDKGEALAGVTVLVEGSKAVTQTDSGGRFEITVPDHARLVISYAGFISQLIEVKGRTSMNVVLQPNTKLNEVVITGYTTQAKHKLTSAIVSVSGEDMSRRVATDPTSLLQGQLPGVSVVQNSAEPGNEDIQIRLRGLGTFSGSVSPLIIVDGIPGSLSAINPNDIESVTALKDAAAATIYGSRGANGVIVVKTKKGRAGTLLLSYNYSIGFSTPTRLPKLINNSADYMSLLNEAYKNTGNFDTVYTQSQIDLYRNATDRTKYPNHDWLKDMFSTAIQQNHYLNLSAGTDKTTYSLGFGYTDQPGTMRGFQFQKYTMSLGLSTRVSNRITFGTNMQVTYGHRIYPYNSSTDLYISTLAQTPLYGPKLADGRWVNKAYPKEQNNKNPVLASTIQTNSPDYYGQGNVSLDINLVKGLTWENRFGLTFDVNKSKYFTPSIPEYYWSDGSYARQADVGTSGLNQSEKDNIHSTLYSQLNYKRQFGNHNLSLLGGLQQDVDNYSEMYAFRDGYPTNLLQELNAGSPTNQTNSGTSDVWAIRSYYGSANYDFNDKYLLGASIRYDGTSKLPANHRWGLYESFSAGWRISQESFLKNVSWLNDLKIRGSWGRLGNVGTLPDYPYQPTLSQGVYAFAGTVSTGFTPTTLVDPALTWESARMTDLGFDMTILQNKLTISADWFDKLTTNILRGSQVPQWLGLNPPQVNNGSVSNKGIELNLRYQDRVNASFSYYASASFQTYRNKLVAFGSPEYGGPDGQTIQANGHPINSFYLYKMAGIFQSQQEINAAPDQSSLGGTPTPGDIRYADINHDGKVDANDRQIFDGQYPKFEYSYTMGFNWKHFDASFQLYGSYGNKVYLYKWGVDPFAQGAPPTTDWYGRWTPQNPSKTMPKIYLGYYGYPKITNVQSTYHLYSASFMRIKNLQLGYTLPAQTIKGLKSVRAFFSVDNLALFTPLKQPTDPERLDINNKPDAWYGFANYPQNRTFTFGASVQF